MLNKLTRSTVAAILLLMLMAWPALAEELPVLRFAYAPSLNETSFIVPVMQGDEYVRDGYSFHPLVAREKYELRKDGKALAIVDIVSGKGASDMAMMMGQGHADMAIFSLSGAIAAVDQGIKIKVVSPLVLATGGLAVTKSIPAKTWDEFIDHIKKSKTPVKIGYHSPTSAPIIILRGAIESEGLKSTEDPYDSTAQVLYVNLKGYSNLQPAMASNQIDAAVGPDPFPQITVERGYGTYIRELRKMPPDNKWAMYPCCIISASDAFIKKHEDVVRAMVKFLNSSGDWCTENQQEAGLIAGKMLGLEQDTSQMVMPTYLREFNQSWLDGAAGYLKSLDETGYINGELKGKKFDEVQPLILDPRFVQ